jgi:hypothetical protein
MMMFVKYIAGDGGWHAVHHYANLTIDDPWLREPYGHVSYSGLLRQMEAHNFHTTIAFIPWNYDRSQPGVISLFRHHPERFSIAVHGDNHDHKEFTNYGSKPLEGQVSGMVQSLARMEKFKELTGLSYDRVMVFPHSIAPLQTVSALGTHGYLATVNESNIPQNEKTPTSKSFWLRPITLSYGGVPSISRQSISVPITPAYIAVNAYLDNPLLFYGHTQDFAGGITSFNQIADAINKIQPDTEWRSLGDLVEHFYLVKEHGASQYDLQAFTNDFRLENTNHQDATFHVEKDESAPAIATLLIDGQPVSYQVENGKLNFSVVVPKQSARGIEVRHGKEPDLRSVTIGHDSAIAYLLRIGSDFRDIYVSKSRVGLAFIRFYNDHEMTPAEVLFPGLLLVFLMIFIAYRLRVHSILHRPTRSANSFARVTIK